MKGKHYKPGQLVTIEGKVYRIKRYRDRGYMCIRCTMFRFCNFGSKVHMFCLGLPYKHYLEPVKKNV